MAMSESILTQYLWKGKQVHIPALNLVLSGDTLVSFFFESVLLNAFSMHFKQCTTMEEVYPMI